MSVIGTLLDASPTILELNLLNLNSNTNENTANQVQLKSIDLVSAVKCRLTVLLASVQCELS